MSNQSTNHFQSPRIEETLELEPLAETDDEKKTIAYFKQGGNVPMSRHARDIQRLRDKYINELRSIHRMRTIEAIQQEQAMTTTTELALHFKDHDIRTVEKDGDVWLVAKDVCEALGIKNHRDAVARIKGEWKADVGVSDTSANGVVQARKVVVINEQATYKLAFRSNKPEAEEFTNRVAQFLRDFREGKVKVRSTPAEQALLPDHAERRIRVLNGAADLLDRVGGWDDQTKVLFADQAKSVALNGG